MGVGLVGLGVWVDVMVNSGIRVGREVVVAIWVGGITRVGDSEFRTEGVAVHTVLSESQAVRKRTDNNPKNKHPAFNECFMANSFRRPVLIPIKYANNGVCSTPFRCHSYVTYMSLDFARSYNWFY